MLARIASATGRDPKWIDPDAKEEDIQLASALLELLRLHVRELVRSELLEVRLSAAAEGGRAG